MFSLFNTCIQGAWDFEFVSVLVHQLIILECGFLLIAAFKMYKIINILDVIIDCFIAQSAIIIFSILIPAFRTATNIFRNDSTLKQAYEQYGNARGMALAGSSFFGLAVPYGILFIILAYHWSNWKYKTAYQRIVVILILLFGAVSAGRTSLIGLFISIIYYIVLDFKFCKRIAYKKRNVFILICMLLTGSLVVFVAFSRQINNNALEVLNRYSFEMIRNFINGKGFTSTSGNALLNMYVPISVKQFLIGDGIYVLNGQYYMDTDVGYLRGLLYFGILGFIILCIYQWYIIKIPGKNRRKVCLVLCIYLTLFIFELKGEVIGILIMLQALLVLVRESLIDQRNLAKD